MVAVDRLRRDAEQLGVGPLLVTEDVAVRLAQKLIARLAVDPHADLVAHRARRHEQRRLLAQHLGDPLFQPAHGRIFAKHVVAHFGRGHRGAHAGRGAGHGIAAQIDGKLHLGFSFRGFPARMTTPMYYHAS